MSIDFECSKSNRYCRICGAKLGNDHVSDVCSGCTQDRERKIERTRKEEQDTLKNIIPKMKEELGIE